MLRPNQRSSTIDLVFSNILIATITREEHLTTRSLYYAISTEIPNNEESPRTPGKVYVTLPEEIKAFAKHVACAASSLPGHIHTKQEINNTTK
jgi:hypothetical protein